MIEIKCKQSDYIARYKGKIILESDEMFLNVYADFTETNHFDDFTWQINVWDRFFLDDIEWIRGTG